MLSPPLLPPGSEPGRMTRTMLAPFDGSEGSRAALAYAAELATDDRLLALHVVEPLPGGPDARGEGEEGAKGRYERAFESARDRLAESRTIAGGSAGGFDAEFHYGHPLHELLLAVDRYVAEEVVMGAHGRDGAGELGNLAESVVRRSPVPVTVVRQNGGNGNANGGLPESVLVPFDGTEPAREALGYALERFPRATVTALFADFPATGDADHLGPGGDRSTAFEDWYGEVREWHGRADRDPERVLGIAGEVATEADRQGTLRTVTEAGDPRRVVLERAGREADHVVVGSHSHARDGVARRLLGSVAASVVRRSPVSVTVVR